MTQLLDVSNPVLTEISPPPIPPTEVLFRLITLLVAVEYGVPAKDVLASGRTQPAARARQMAYLLCHTFHKDIPAIARFFNRDQKTVRKGVTLMGARIHKIGRTASTYGSLKFGLERALGHRPMEIAAE